MSRVVYSSQLFLGHAVPFTSIAVPSNERWVVRTITLFYPAVIGVQTFQMIDTATSATLVQDDNGSGIGATWHFFNDLRITLEEGRSFSVDGGGSTDVGLFGYAFVLP